MSREHRAGGLALALYPSRLIYQNFANVMKSKGAGTMKDDKERYDATPAEVETLSDTTDADVNAAQEEMPVKE